MTIGQVIFTLRRSRQLSLTELAEKSGVTSREIAMLEQGQRVSPKLSTLEKLAKGFGMKTSRLVEMMEGQSHLSVEEKRNAMQIGERIKAARKKAGLTQKQLGEKMGISYQAVAQWENDLRNPKIETLRAIANALGVPVSDLISVEGYLNEQQ